jgi:hypothetical protein
MTADAVAAHQAKHFPSQQPFGGVTATPKCFNGLPMPVKMTRPEREYGLILAAMKSRDEITDYRWQGMSLAWGEDPATGRLMRYKCDWLVISRAGFTLIETKGPHIFRKDVIRFKGCRAAWPMFKFEMHQLAQGAWRQIL